MALLQIGQAWQQASMLEEDRKEADVRKRNGDVLRAFDEAEDGFLRRCELLGLGAVAARAKRDLALSTVMRLLDHCESPIERMMLGPLMLANYDGFGSLMPAAYVPSKDQAVPASDLLLVPQFAFVRYRLDLAVVGSSERNTKIVALECDGEAYHRDAVRERSRDEFFNKLGVEVIHANGKEIYADPVGVASRVATVLVDWIASEKTVGI